MPDRRRKPAHPLGMTATERAAWRWLLASGEREEDLVYLRRATPDIIHADGRSWEVKLVRHRAVTLSTTQAEQLAAHPETVLLLWSSPTHREPAAQIRYGDLGPLPCEHGKYVVHAADFRVWGRAQPLSGLSVDQKRTLAAPTGRRSRTIQGLVTVPEYHVIRDAAAIAFAGSVSDLIRAAVREYIERRAAGAA